MIEDEKQKQTEPEAVGALRPMSKEAAKVLVADLLDFYDVDLDDVEDEAAQASHRAACNRIGRAVAKGSLEIKQENGFPILYLRLRHKVTDLPAVLRIREIDGAAKMRTKELSANAYGRMYALIAGLSGQKVEDIARLIGQDLSIVESISAVFLGV